MAWLSIVTVVKDDREGFARTLESIRRQQLVGVEWVIVDGSHDSTSIPNLLTGAPDGLAVSYAHEPPAGIYPAMNVGLTMATGEFIVFLNAGDSLFDESVVVRLRQAMYGKPVWAFGPVEIIERTGLVVMTPRWDYTAEKSASFGRGHFPPHQGTVASRQALLDCGGFDSDYRIAADYAMFLRLSLLAEPLELPFPLATFREGGASTVGWKQSFLEFHKARKEILRPHGFHAIREQWETARHFALVYAAREIRPRLSFARRARS